MYTPKLPVPSPLRGADAGSFAEHSIVHRLPHIAQRVLADNPLTAAMRHRIADLIAAIPHRTLEAFTDPAAPDMPRWHDCVFRAKVATDSSRRLPLIPIESCH